MFGVSASGSALRFVPFSSTAAGFSSSDDDDPDEEDPEDDDPELEDPDDELDFLASGFAGVCAFAGGAAAPLLDPDDEESLSDELEEELEDFLACF